MSDKSSYLDDYPSPYGVFRHEYTIGNMELFMSGNEHWAPLKPLTRGNISCSLVIRNNIDQETLGFYINLDPKNRKDVPRWSIDAKVILKLVHQNEATKSKGYEMKFFELKFVPFDETARIRGIRNAVAKSVLLDANNGFLVNNRMKIIIDIRIASIEGFNSPKFFNFYEEYKISSGVWYGFVGVPGVREIQCNKTLPTFHSIDFSKNYPREDEYWNIYSFESFLKVLHGEEVHVKDFFEVLYFARNLNVPAVTRRIEFAILTGDFPEVHQRCFLELAYHFNLRRVIHAHLRTVSIIKKKTLITLPVDHMSGEVMKAVMNRFFGIYEERLWRKEEKKRNKKKNEKSQ